jgi:DNA-binding transcriptional MocR family regulator
MQEQTAQTQLKQELQQQYNALKAQGLKLDMSRGKPSPEQLDLSSNLLTINAYIDDSGADARNYGFCEGLPEARRFFAELLEVNADECLVGGNSSLELMYHAVECFKGLNGHQPGDKWLCPSPGYDRHFRVTEKLGYSLISVPMTVDGPDMDVVETLVKDDKVKGIWCVPLYSNPDGYSYSDAVVKRLAAMSCGAADFKIIWDNAYGWHHLTSSHDSVLNIFEECRKVGNDNRPLMFCSTSKITFAGAGVAAMAGSIDNIKIFAGYLSNMTIGFDKVNQLRHVRYLKDANGLAAHMEKHAALLRPKFQVVLDVFAAELGESGNNDSGARWTTPKGGYFISLFTKPGCAKKVVSLCKEAGVILTGAGAAYPYGVDPNDAHIRISPSYPGVDDLRQAARLLALCVKLAAF